jgi:hypothetical protein
MTTWTDISNAAVSVGGIPSSATVTALRDNPMAMAEAATGAPVVFAGWHPYNKVAVGDANSGVIYDSAVNGTVASVETPNFEDGYEYRLLAANLSHNAGSASLRLELYFEVASAYSGGYVTALTGGSTTQFYVDAEILFPRVSRRGHLTRIVAGVGSTLDTAQNLLTTASSAADTVLKARLIFSSGSVDGGQVWLMRRREYISSP